MSRKHDKKQGHALIPSQPSQHSHSYHSHVQTHLLPLDPQITSLLHSISSSQTWIHSSHSYTTSPPNSHSHSSHRHQPTLHLSPSSTISLAIPPLSPTAHVYCTRIYTAPPSSKTSDRALKRSSTHSVPSFRHSSTTQPVVPSSPAQARPAKSTSSAPRPYTISSQTRGALPASQRTTKQPYIVHGNRTENPSTTTSKKSPA